MPRKPPAEPIDHHYNIPRLNRAFFWTALALTVVFVVMVVADYTRDWKVIQRTFLRLDSRMTRQAALAARQKALGEEHARMIGELKATRAEIAQHQANLRRLNAKLKDLDPKVYLADQQYKFTKASFDAQRYKYEDALANKPRAAASARRSLDALQKELDERTLHLAQLKKEQSDAQAAIDRVNARSKELET
jgi:chromosome segregation ATPase